MFYLPRKFAAVLLAVWLPLFTGNALAVSVGMQSISGNCHTVEQQDLNQSPQYVSSSHQHMHHAQMTTNSDQSSMHQEHIPNGQRSSSHKDCGVCQLACCGYMATVAIEVAQIKPAAQLFAFSATQFQSFFSAPLVPPPLARA